MSTIQIRDLAPAGLHLFSDSETYLTDLGPDDITQQQIHGGSTPCCIATAIYVAAAVGGAVIGNAISNALG